MTRRGNKPMPMDEAVTKDLADIRIAASTSFGPDEVMMLKELFAKLLNGGDVKTLVRSKSFANVHRKVFAMERTVARMRERRDERARRHSQSSPEPAPAADVQGPENEDARG